MELTLFFVYVVIFLILSFNILFEIFTKKIVKDRVVGKERHTGYYIIYGENQVYKNVDSWVYNKFNSSNVQARIKIGHEYTFTVVGMRFKWFSNYQNIIKYEENEN